MRAVVQRVTRASVAVDNEIVGNINSGLLVLLGIARDDTETDADYLADKIAALRIFDDEEGKMNRSLHDIRVGRLIVAHFPLFGAVRRGLRPWWSDAAAPKVPEPL